MTSKGKPHRKLRFKSIKGFERVIETGWVDVSSYKEEECFSAHNWTAFNFKPLDAGTEYIYDLENYCDKKRTDSKFMKELWRELDLNKDSLITYDELKHAYEILEIQDSISKIVCKHKLEWSYDFNTIKSEIVEFYDYAIGMFKGENEIQSKLKEVKEEKLIGLEDRVNNLTFWKDLQKVTYDPPPPKENPETTRKKVTVLSTINAKPIELKVSSSLLDKFSISKEVNTTTTNRDVATVNETNNLSEAPEVKEETATNTKKEEEIKRPKRKLPSTDQVYHFHPIAFINQMKLMFPQGETGECYCNKDFTVEDVERLVLGTRKNTEIWQGVTKSCPVQDKSYKALTDELNKMFEKYNITKCIQKITFLALAGAETGLFQQSIEELSKYKSSQSTYKGRGLVQLTGNDDGTGYYNDAGVYQKYADHLGDQSIVTNPDKVSENIHYVVDAGGYYFDKAKRVPKWTGTDNVTKKKKNYFSKALGKSLNETSLLISEDFKYYYLIAKLMNGYSTSHFLEKDPISWKKRVTYFHLMKGLFKYETQCSNNPKLKSFEDKAPWMKIALEEAYEIATISEQKWPTIGKVKHCGLNDNTIQWCAAYVCWSIDQTKYKSAKSARSQNIIANEGKFYKKIDKPFFGCIVVFSNYVNGSKDGSGHVNFLYGYNKRGKKLICLGGNQGGKAYGGGTAKFSQYADHGVTYSYTSTNKAGVVTKVFEQKFAGYFAPIDYEPKEEEYNIELYDIIKLNKSLGSLSNKIAEHDSSF